MTSLNSVIPAFPFDLWQNRFHTLPLIGLRESRACTCCGKGKYEWLEGRAGTHTTTLCGRNAVQVVPATRQGVDFAELAKRLANLGPVSHNRFLLRFSAEDVDFSVFADGRAILKGTDDIALARTLYSRYLGN